MAILAFSSNNIFDSTSAGRALLTAADASAQRTLLGLSSSSAVSFQSLVLSGQNLTGSTATSVFDATTTWNTTGTPIAWKLNITDIASNSSSLFLALQADGVNQFSVRKDGRVTFKSNSVIDQNGSAFLNTLTLNGGKADLGGTYATNIAQFKSNYGIGWNSGDANTSNVDTLLYRDSAGILAQRNGVNAQAFRLYNTYTDASNYERGKFAWESNALRIGTEKLGTGAARALELQVDGTTRLSIPTTGDILLTPNGTTDRFQFASGGFKYLTTGGVIASCTFTMGPVSFPFSNIAVGGTAGAASTNSTFSTTRTQTFDAAFSSNLFSTTLNTPASSTQAQNSVTIATTVNQGAGSTAVTRGLYVNPTLTSAADWRSIETSNNTGWAIYAAGTANSFFNGNVGIGTTSPTVKLDIAGTLEVKNGLSPQNIHIYNTYTNPSNYERARIGWESNALIFGAESAGTGALREIHIYTNGNKKLTVGAGGAQLSFGSNAAPPLIYAMSWPFYGDASLSGQGLGFRSDVNDPNTQGFVFGGNPASITSGALSVVQIERSFLPTSGTGVFNAFRIRCLINQTGGANGITRGIFINPTLTSAADWRAIEITAGKTIVAPSTTTSASLNIPSGTAPTSPVDGDIWFDGTALKIRIGGVTKTVTVT